MLKFKLLRSPMIQKSSFSIQKQLLIAILFLFTSFHSNASSGYEIKVRLNGLKDTICYLGNHFGDKQYVKDTVRVDHDGWAVFKGNEPLPEEFTS